MKRGLLITLAFVVASVCVVTAIALPSIDPCRVGDQLIMGCPFTTPTFDRVGLRLTIAGVGLLAGVAVFLWSRRMSPTRSIGLIGSSQLSINDNLGA